MERIDEICSNLAISKRRKYRKEEEVKLFKPNKEHPLTKAETQINQAFRAIKIITNRASKKVANAKADKIKKGSGKVLSALNTNDLKEHEETRLNKRKLMGETQKAETETRKKAKEEEADLRRALLHNSNRIADGIDRSNDLYEVVVKNNYYVPEHLLRVKSGKDEKQEEERENRSPSSSY